MGATVICVPVNAAERKQIRAAMELEGDRYAVTLIRRRLGLENNIFRHDDRQLERSEIDNVLQLTKYVCELSTMVLRQENHINAMRSSINKMAHRLRYVVPRGVSEDPEEGVDAVAEFLRRE